MREEKTGYSRVQWQTLSALVLSEGPVATLELASRVAVRWPLIRVLDELERQGLINRLRNPDDKRSTIIAVTPEGRQAMARVQDTLDPLRSQLLQSFSNEDLVLTEEVMNRLFVLLVHETGA